MAEPTLSRITIRPATDSDAMSICQIGASTFKASFEYSMPVEHCAAYVAKTYNVRTIAAEITNPESTFFVADNGEQVVGFIQMKVNTTEPCLPENISLCELHRIYVSMNEVGRGLGGLLIAKGLKWAAEYAERMREHRLQEEGLGDENQKSDAACWLGVWEHNEKAQRLYNRYGFTEIAGKHAFQIGDTTQYDTILLKWL